MWYQNQAKTNRCIFNCPAVVVGRRLSSWAYQCTADSNAAEDEAIRFSPTRSTSSCRKEYVGALVGGLDGAAETVGGADNVGDIDGKSVGETDAVGSTEIEGEVDGEVLVEGGVVGNEVSPLCCTMAWVGAAVGEKRVLVVVVSLLLLLPLLLPVNIVTSIMAVAKPSAIRPITWGERIH